MLQTQLLRESLITFYVFQSLFEHLDTSNLATFIILEILLPYLEETLEIFHMSLKLKITPSHY